MSPSRRCKLFCKAVGLSLVAAAIQLSLTLFAAASTNLAGAFNVPAPSSSKYCSGAFRYAARTGNVDIVELSPVQIFAKDRRLSRMRYSARGMYNAEAGISPLHALTAMCGAR